MYYVVVGCITGNSNHHSSKSEERLTEAETLKTLSTAVSSLPGCNKKRKLEAKIFKKLEAILNDMPGMNSDESDNDSS